MLTSSTRDLPLRILANYLKRATLDRCNIQKLSSTILDLAEKLDMPRLAKNKVLQKTRSKTSATHEVKWQKVLKAVKQEMANSRSDDLEDINQRIHQLSDQLSLTESDSQILELLICYQTDQVISSLVCDLSNCLIDLERWYRHDVTSLTNPTLAHIAGLTMSRLRERFSVRSPLVQSGLASVDEDGDIRILDRLSKLVFEPTNSTRYIEEILFEEAPPAELEWEDFEHVAADRDHIERLIRGALKTGTKGVNILLYGPPGTGKTEFCRTICKRLELNLIAVGESDEGEEPTRNERLRELRLATRLLGESQNSLLLFDEMEDILSTGSDGGGWLSELSLGHKPRNSKGSKVFLHRLLENNAVPTLWTTNSAAVTNPTILRRMMFAMELRQPSSRIRSRIWRRQLTRHDIPSTEEDAETLAHQFDVTPGVADRAVAAARLVDGGDISTVHRGVESLSRLIYGPKPPITRVENFDPSLVCASSDPLEIADQLAGLNTKKFSVFLQGPPGTGKSAFVRYLAERVGMEVLQKRASDLMSMWVGGTEKNIARAFSEAREQELFLIFDEADSLLGDRRFAERNWEVSEVNEMLTWLENHPFPVACTTNFGERIDPATLRRFDFKLKVDYLSPEKLHQAFRLFFNMKAPEDIKFLTNLTPGDFRVVHRRAELLGKMSDANTIASMLKEESETKPAQVRPIGFTEK